MSSTTLAPSKIHSGKNKLPYGIVFQALDSNYFGYSWTKRAVQQTKGARISQEGKSDLLGFIRSKARGLLGKSITFTKGKKGIKLTIRASGEAELREIWERIVG